MNRRPLILVTVLLSALSFPLTITGAAVALPMIQTDLDSTLTATQWVVNGYNTCFAGFLAVAGSLADRLGRRRVFSLGVTLFLMGSLACVLAGDIALLNAARAVAGIGAAAATATGSSILAAGFEGAARTRVFGFLGTVLGIGLAFGPTVSGVLVTAVDWRAVFATPALLAGVVLVLCPLLPRLAGARNRRIDWLGGSLFTSALVLVIFVLVEAPSLGIAHPVIVGAAVAAVLSVFGFVYVERRTPDPMFNLKLLANRPFLAYTLGAATMMGLLVPLLVYLPSYLMAAKGMDADRAGLWLLLLTVPSVVLPGVGALAAKYSARGLTVGALLLSGTGCVLLLLVESGGGLWSLPIPLVLIGSGVGLTTGVVDGLAISQVDSSQAGTAAGLFNTGRLATETTSLAIVGTTLAVISNGDLTGDGFTLALHCVGIGLAGLAGFAVIGVVTLLRRR